MTRCIPLLLCCLTIHLARAATPLDLTQVPEKTRWLVHLDVDGFLASDLGTWLQARIKEDGHLPKITALTSLARFDPFKDLRSLTLGGTTPDPDTAVLYIRGTFDQEHLLTLLKANDDYQATVHGATIIHSWPDKGSRSYGCFAGPDLIIITRNPSALDVCLDTIAGTASNLAAVPGIAAIMEKPAFLVAAATRVADLRNTHPQAAILENVQDVFLQLIQADGKLTAAASIQATSEETATLVQQTVLGARALALLNASGQPEIVNRLAEGLTVTREGQILSAALSLPVTEVLRLIESQADKRQQQRHAAEE